MAILPESRRYTAHSPESVWQTRVRSVRERIPADCGLRTVAGLEVHRACVCAKGGEGGASGRANRGLHFLFSSTLCRITCPDGSQASFAPAPGTIKRSSERGMTCGHPGWPADCVSRIVTPRAQEAAAAHFGCSSIPGPELENQPTGGCRLYGSHLEQRVFMSDFMASTVVESDWTTSAVYFGIMEDSGWYLANYSMVTPLATGMGWGFKQGCDVAMNYCIDPDTKKPVSELQFCKSSPGNNLFGCSTDR